MNCICCGREDMVSIVEEPHHTKIMSRNEPQVVMHSYQWYNCSNCGHGWAEGELIDQHLRVSRDHYTRKWKFRGYISDLEYNRRYRFGEKKEKLLRRINRGRRKRFPPESFGGYPYIYRKERGSLPTCFHPIHGRNRRRFRAYIPERK